MVHSRRKRYFIREETPVLRNGRRMAQNLPLFRNVATTPLSEFIPTSKRQFNGSHPRLYGTTRRAGRLMANKLPLSVRREWAELLIRYYRASINPGQSGPPM